MTIWLLALLAALTLALPPQLSAASRKRNIPAKVVPVLRVAAPDPLRQASIISPYGPGFEPELVALFCDFAGYAPLWISVGSRSEGILLLEKGGADLLVGFWDDAPSTLPRTAFPAGIAAGRPYAHFSPVQIRGVASARPGLPTPGQGKTVIVDAPLTAGGLIMDAAPAAGYGKSPAPSGQPPDGGPSGFGPANLPVYTLAMDGGDDPSRDLLLLDPASYSLWLPFLGDVGIRHIKKPMPYRWFWRDDKTFLAIQLETFWREEERDAELSELTERYMGFLPPDMRQRDVMELAETMSERMPAYAEMILAASKKTGVPPLLLVAVIYQESRFAEDAVSRTRVRGIMQITAGTARELGINRNDPAQCIMGGARYLKILYNKIGRRAKTDWDRWYMALAAYNQGLSNLYKTMALAREMGLKGNTWADLKVAFPRSAGGRGIEARGFVQRVRYYYFLLHGLIALAPPEAEDFAPLLRLALAGGSGF